MASPSQHERPVASRDSDPGAPFPQRASALAAVIDALLRACVVLDVARAAP